MEKEVNIKIEGKEWEEALDKAFEKANEQKFKKKSRSAL